MNTLPETAIVTATEHLNDILRLAIRHTSQQAALIISDTESPLAIALTEAYKRVLPESAFIDFNSVEPAEIFAAFKQLQASDLVVLIQTTNFRLKDFRLRVELFEQSLKVIEHPHLGRMSGEEAIYYINALAYDSHYYHNIGQALKRRIDSASRCIIDSLGEQLICESPLEPAKLNIGDYTGMKNIGGQFPIGEVFTESQDLESVNGRVRLFAFADRTFRVNKPETPITLVINKGRVTETLNSTPEFESVLNAIRADEGEVWLREIGFGMNRAFTPDKTVSDIGTYERMCGIHLSLGAKHGVYKKAHIKRGTAWYHVDVFAITHLVYLDDAIVFENQAWKV